MLEIILEVSPGLTDQRKITSNLIEKWPKNHRKFLTFPTDNISRELKQCYHKNREHLFIKTH